MDSRKYDRLKLWGALFQELRNKRTLSTTEKLYLEILRSLSVDYDRCLLIFKVLSEIDEPIETLDLAHRLNVGKESTVQTMRALREGGFEFRIYERNTYWYQRLEIPKSSVLQMLIDRAFS